MKIQPKEQERTCDFCGAPIRSEVCPYCGKVTGLDSATAVMDYPEVKCKEASLGFFSIVFPLIFFLGFGLSAIVALLVMVGSGVPGGFLFSLPFLFIGCGAGFILFKNLWYYISVKLHGKEIEGTVYGYANDVISYNDTPGQVCKLLVNSSNGPRFIMYQLKGTGKPYAINTKIPLKVYKDRFMILDNHKYEVWQ